MTNDVINYDGAIVDNTDRDKRIVILTDQKGAYKQVFFPFVKDSDQELIERCRLMRALNIPSY